MFIKAMYNNEECLLNADYIVDIFNADKWVADVYVLDIDRDCYKVKQSEIQRLIDDTADTPQTECDTCRHYKPACELFSEVCKYEPTTQTETENSNLTFEKVMEEIQTQVIEFPDTHQKFTFARKIEMDGDSIKIGGWEYKGVKDAERFVKGAERFVKGSEQTERSSE